ncbi:MAG: DUF1398 family protein [Bacteroidia bacterium]|nr:DUF1398 family protein [Bacteroidia bacterium]
MAQIKTAHTKVKSEPYFLNYINKISTLGVTHYIRFCSQKYY